MTTVPELDLSDRTLLTTIDEFDGDLIRIYQEVFPQCEFNLQITGKIHIEEWLQAVNDPYQSDSQWYGLYPYYGTGYDSLNNSDLYAFCTIGNSDGAFYFLYNFGVLSNSRYWEYGYYFLKTLIETLNPRNRPHEHKNIYLFVNNWNREAIRLYRNFDFEFTDSAFVPPEDTICMVRQVHNQSEIQLCPSALN